MLKFNHQKNPLSTISRFLFFILAMQLLACAVGCQKSDSETGAGAPSTKITLLAPKGGEMVSVGDTLWIKWSIKDDSVDPFTAVDLEVSPDSGKTWDFIKNGSIPVEAPSWGNFPLVVPAISQGKLKFPLANTNCLFRIKEYETNDITKTFITKKTFLIIGH